MARLLKRTDRLRRDWAVRKVSWSDRVYVGLRTNRFERRGGGGESSDEEDDEVEVE